MLIFKAKSENLWDNCHFTINEKGIATIRAKNLPNNAQEVKFLGVLLPYQFAKQNFKNEIQAILDKPEPCQLTDFKDKFGHYFVILNARKIEQLVANGLALVYQSENQWLWELEKIAAQKQIGVWQDSAQYWHGKAFKHKNPIKFAIFEGEIKNFTHKNHRVIMLELGDFKNPDSSYQIEVPIKYLRDWKIKDQDLLGMQILAKGFTQNPQTIIINHQNNLIFK